MLAKANGHNALGELAKALLAGGNRPAAVAVRMLVQAGFASIEQVDSLSDCVLLSIPGIGMGRLGELRRLTRASWEPPLPQVLQAGNGFQYAATFALRHWSPDNLESLVLGTVPATTPGLPMEKRLALDLFSRATHRAIKHFSSSELIGVLRFARNGHRFGTGCQDPQPRYNSKVQVDTLLDETKSLEEIASEQPDRDDVVAESDRYAYSPRRRREIVQHFRAARDRGLIEHKDRWANSHYNITGRTLLNYEREFPEAEQQALYDADDLN